MNDFFNNQRILGIIWKRKYHFVIIGFIAVLLAAVFSSPFFITPKYKSTARVYPTRNIFVFSEESESEQLLEVMNSRDIKMKVIDALRLDEVYKISKSDPHYLTYMMDIYNKNIKTRKTEYETVEISVLDSDPQRACNICDSIIHFYNLKVAEMHAVKYLEMAKLSEVRLTQKFVELDSLKTKFDIARTDYNIIDYKNQVKEVTKSYMKSMAAKNTELPVSNPIKKQYENLKNFGAEAFINEKRYLEVKIAIDSLIESKTIALVEANKRITYSHVVEAPLPADKKSYPVRWIIVLFSAVSAVFFGLLAFLVIDYRREEQPGA